MGAATPVIPATGAFGGAPYAATKRVTITHGIPANGAFGGAP